MKRPVCQTTPTPDSRPRPPSGYTMVEILVATALMLTIMLAVAWVFGMVGETIADSRSTLEMSGELRNATMRLKKELDGATATMVPPLNPDADQGYFEVTEGAIGPVIARQLFNPVTGEYQPYNIARNFDAVRVPPPVAGDPDQNPYEIDPTVGDFDDMVSFTTRSNGEPFIGQCAQKRAPVGAETPYGMDDFDNDGTRDNPYTYTFATMQSDVAEISYFVRGGTLYRRVQLVNPGFPVTTPFRGNMDTRDDPASWLDPIYELDPAGFYNNDISVRQERRYNSAFTPPWEWVLAANTLGDLTKRENRFAHRARIPASGARAGFPYHPHWWCPDDLTDPAAAILRPTHWGTHYTFIPATDAWTRFFFPSPASPRQVYPGLGLPTLQECSHPDWPAGGLLPNLVNTAIIPPTGQLPLTQTDIYYDVWKNPHPYAQQDPVTGSLAYDPATFPPQDPVEPPLYLGPRVGEDVVLTNVVAFDVKVWDPQAWVLPAIDAGNTPTDLTVNSYWTAAEFLDDGVIPGAAVVPGDPGYELALAHAMAAEDSGTVGVFSPLGQGAYVDLGYMESININGRASLPGWQALKRQLLSFTPFAGPGNRRSQMKRVYDTWSTHYESNWFDGNLNGVKGAGDSGNENRNNYSPGNPIIDEGTDGIDNDGDGLVDDLGEQEAPAPYPVPLRGMQIKIRVFDTDSRQIRESTVVCDFLPK